MTARFCPCLAAALLSATPALADLTVHQAWDVWKAQFRALGVELETAEDIDGQSLQIGRIGLIVRLSDDMGVFRLTFDGPRFSPTGDGGVRVIMPAQFDIQFHADLAEPDGGRTDVSAVLQVTAIGQEAVMRGDPQRATTFWTGKRWGASLLAVQADGELLDVLGTLSVEDYAAENTTEIGDMVRLWLNGDYAGYHMRYAIGDEEGEEYIASEEHAETYAARTKITLPAEGLSGSALAQQIADGAGLHTQMTSGQSRGSDILIEQGQVVNSSEARATGSAASLGLSRDGLSMTIGADDLDFEYALADLPFDIAFLAPRVEAAFRFPILKSDLPQTYKLALEMAGVSLADSLWALVDPDAVLPREPVSLAMDISGETRVTHNLFDLPALPDLGEDELPLLIDTVDIARVSVAGLGAHVQAAGGFAFDHSDYETLPDFPRTEGVFEIDMTGVNGLVGLLADNGILPEEQASGIRMMLGLFAVPGEGEDVLTSVIEVTPDGQVLANGQRLK